jgi:hypothetical protein
MTCSSRITLSSEIRPVGWPATATHLGWTLNTGYGIAVLILGLLSTTAWAKATAHDATATPPGNDTGTPSPRDPSPAAGTRAPVPS